MCIEFDFITSGLINEFDFKDKNIKLEAEELLKLNRVLRNYTVNDSKINITYFSGLFESLLIIYEGGAKQISFKDKHKILNILKKIENEN